MLIYFVVDFQDQEAWAEPGARKKQNLISEVLTGLILKKIDKILDSGMFYLVMEETFTAQLSWSLK